MNNKQKNALISSIKHWEENVKLVKNRILPKIGSHICPCCIAFPHCISCPISEYSDDIGCENTPYIFVLDNYLKHGDEEIDWIKLLKAVKKELKFLKDILEYDN